MMIKEEKRQMFGQLLMEKKMVNECQIEEALEVQKANGKALGNILIDLGHTTSDLIMSVLNITRKTEQKLARLFNASIGILQCSEQTSLLNFIMAEAERILESDMCNLFLVDEDANEFKCFFIHNEETREIRLPRNVGLAGYVSKASESINLEDAYQSPLFDPQIDNMLEYKTETVLCIPVKQKDNKVIGALQVVNKKGKGRFTPHDEWLLKSFAIFASNAISMINSNKDVTQEVRFTENLKMLNLAVENLSEGVIIITQDDDSVVVNPAVKWMLDWNINKAIDKQNTIALLNRTGLKDIPAWLKGEADTLTSQEITIQTPETRVIRVDCTEINGEFNHKKKRGCLVVFKDITRDKEFQQIKSEFITVASHELLSPITSMKNSINLLLQEIPGPNTDSQKKFLHIINDGIEYLSNLSTTLMDIAMSEIRKVPLKREKVDLSKVIKSAMESQWFKADEKKISFVNNNGNTPPVLADTNRIRQVLLNLLDNAFKFIHDGGEISVSAKSTGGEVEISVKDNGPGIFLEEQVKIFEKFYQVENAATKKHYGIGLGLSICKDIVEAQGGRIWVESKERDGSNFVFTLPLYK
ncbi:MAG: GAF domain-containing sensor histidine kinase [Candidatus Scalindua rubra]|nr:GAF domain-containing sensor histidine kinase [Candidatus Scalindua rubra]TWU36763.1 Alginate biosynthesis sensor protein KinB [Candidatus Brocadiaceae bacterium S225]